MQIRGANVADADGIAMIFNQGIDDRIATFETRPRSPEEIMKWFDNVHPIIVAEDSSGIIGFASTSSYRSRECYSGIAECSTYIRRDLRGKGVGRLVLNELIKASKEAGFWKLVSRIFVENTASRSLIGSLGFREVGIYKKHAQLDGIWRDVVIVERLLIPESSNS
jgi:L-amino acid N-acyltransferase YncA